jgi:hypothetical protein
MSQADSAYTTSRSILPAGLALRRRQFVTGGAAAALAAAVTASRAASVAVPAAPDPILAAIAPRTNAKKLFGPCSAASSHEMDSIDATLPCMFAPPLALRPWRVNTERFRAVAAELESARVYAGFAITAPQQTHRLMVALASSLSIIDNA